LGIMAPMPIPDAINFRGLRVLSLESRRSTELAALIATYGGQPIVAPALREVPLESNRAALDFAARLVAGQFDVVVFLTGVGARALVAVIDQGPPLQVFTDALSRTKVVVRGPKPLAVLRELKVPIWVAAPEPNTWRDVVGAIEQRAEEQPLRGARIAVQEYGVSNTEFLDELRARGALVTPVPVYRWALPEDVQPLKNAAAAIARGEVDVALFTTSMQVVHLWRIVGELGLEDDVRRELRRTVIASIGPTTSDELQRHSLPPDVEASHPKIGILVREAAEYSAALLQSKRAGEKGRPRTEI
jgi:uroporphyrinogen-III synthase